MGEGKNKNPLLTATVLPTEGKIKHCSLNPLLPQAGKKRGHLPAGYRTAGFLCRIGRLHPMTQFRHLVGNPLTGRLDKPFHGFGRHQSEFVGDLP